MRHDRLRIISNFSGSAGIAIILKRKNFLFVDGRYTLQAKSESGENFQIIEIPKQLPKNILNKLKLGFDPNLFTKAQLNYFFGKNIRFKPINENLVDIVKKPTQSKIMPFYSLPNIATGNSSAKKIHEVSNIINKKKADYLFISAPENVAWLLNIRGSDVPFSPIPNCNCLISKNKKVFLLSNKKQLTKLSKEKNFNYKIIDPNKFEFFLSKLKGKSIVIDSKTCSIFKEKIISKYFKIKAQEDPCYLLKSKKNPIELNNMIKAHIEDGVALTKFIFWIKNKKNLKISELEAEKKLESFRKKSKNYLYPSFNTIAGSGPNGAIVHYRATKDSNRLIKKRYFFM